MARLTIVLAVLAGAFSGGEQLHAQYRAPFRNAARTIGHRWGPGYHVCNPGHSTSYYSPWSAHNSSGVYLSDEFLSRNAYPQMSTAPPVMNGDGNYPDSPDFRRTPEGFGDPGSGTSTRESDPLDDSGETDGDLQGRIRSPYHGATNVRYPANRPLLHSIVTQNPNDSFEQSRRRGAVDRRSRGNENPAYDPLALPPSGDLVPDIE